MSHKWQFDALFTNKSTPKEIKSLVIQYDQILPNYIILSDKPSALKTRLGEVQEPITESTNNKEGYNKCITWHKPNRQSNMENQINHQHKKPKHPTKYKEIKTSLAWLYK